MNDQVLTAIQNAWDKWPEIKHTVVDYGFMDWCRREHGFEYHHNDGRKVIATVLDEQKYAWFLLRWS